jgi:hypothetical protein
MASLNVHVNVVNGKTVSGFGATAGGKIKFYNHGAAELTVAVKPNVFPSSPLCKGPNDNGPMTSFTVNAGKHETVYVCDSFAGKEFAYSAQVAGSILEDPIIIIQKDDFTSYLGEHALAIGISFIAGVILAVLAPRVFATRRPT